MAEISGRLAEHGLKIELSESARDWLAHEGYDPQFGARPVRRTLERYVENPLAKRLLAGEFKDGDTVVVDTEVDEDGQMQLAFFSRPPEPIAVELPMSHQLNGQEMNGK
jgi:ATP-dependent Clp protease ATP-binding subunit ClpA